MTATNAAESGPRHSPAMPPQARVTLLTCTLVFFVITLDAVIVNVALPSISTELGGGIGDLQWIVDAYTLMFAALLLTCGSLADRIGAKRLLLAGMALFVVASIACGLAPSMPVLIASRFVQGTAAAAMMPASMALLNHAYPEARGRTRAVAIWAMGGAVASTSGPVLGGLLTLASWRGIFFINVPVGVIGLYLILRSISTPRHTAPVDWAGQLAGVLAMSGLTFGLIDAGEAGFTAAAVLISLGVALVAIIAFIVIEARAQHPMVPTDLFRDHNAGISMLIGFAFMVGYYGLPFVMSLTLQQHRGLSALGTGLVFLPMMLSGLILTPFTPSITERIGQKTLIVTGLASLSAGLVLLAAFPAAPLWLIAVLMVLAGLAGPFVMPPTTALLLGSVPAHRSGIASGVFNTSRQVGGALAVAMFGLMLSSLAFPTGQSTALLTAAGITVVTAGAALLLRPRRPR
ncbi:MFS transporter [Arthrobacter bambusae]|uniref:MFS transporter n=1 Tax=Arthrobacter bambusae TaxID=1338426 RepID=UPI0027879635|nr:MFS transporter [Arthrobacter bambusae]MDQ0032090.1 EmrB/QacA subfamily drug resistance transporter [Arthrobacter bambusae]MDQ0100230.1 EmrB/QacA subfamily drug resistance transporter [Arthrobacter bambusae]